MKLYMIIEYKNEEPVWTDGKTFSNKEDAVKCKDYYIKHRFKSSDSLKIKPLNLKTGNRPSKTNTNTPVPA